MKQETIDMDQAFYEQSKFPTDLQGEIGTTVYPRDWCIDVKDRWLLTLKYIKDNKCKILIHRGF